MSLVLLLFFFQAEDGIRDYKVTWSSDVCSSDLEGRHRDVEAIVHGLSRERADRLPGGVCNSFNVAVPSLALDRRQDGKPGGGHPQAGPAKGSVRSEERRVGKEAGRGRSAYDGIE